MNYGLKWRTSRECLMDSSMFSVQEWLTLAVDDWPDSSPKTDWYGRRSKRWMTTLIGPKRLFSPIQAWFEAFQQGSPSVYPLILVGDSRTVEDIPRQSFRDQERIWCDWESCGRSAHISIIQAIVWRCENADILYQRRCYRGRYWFHIQARLETSLTSRYEPKAFPLVIIADSKLYRMEIPKGCIGASNPFSFHREIPLESIFVLFLDGDQEHIDWCARNATTWRGSRFYSRPHPLAWVSATTKIPTKSAIMRKWKRFFKDVMKAISHHTHWLSCNRFQWSQSTSLEGPMELHSKSWLADLLGSISRAYLGTLRTKSWISHHSERENWRNRSLWSEMIIKYDYFSEISGSIDIVVWLRKDMNRPASRTNSHPNESRRPIGWTWECWNSRQESYPMQQRKKPAPMENPFGFQQPWTTTPPKLDDAEAKVPSHEAAGHLRYTDFVIGRNWRQNQGRRGRPTSSRLHQHSWRCESQSPSFSRLLCREVERG